MLRTFMNAFRVADLRKKIAFTAAMLLLYRIGAYIPAPGINIDAVKSISSQFAGSNVLGFLNLFSGGSLSRFAIFALGVIAAIVFIQEGQRRIPVQYAKRVVGRRMAGGGSTYLPLRVNMAGVIPVIFAASLMAFPPTVGELTQASWARDFSAFFNPGDAPYIIGESLFIVLFTYFYTAVTFNPVEQSDNLKKYGGFIPGVRPGRPTAE